MPDEMWAGDGVGTCHRDEGRRGCQKPLQAVETSVLLVKEDGASMSADIADNGRFTCHDHPQSLGVSGFDGTLDLRETVSRQCLTPS